MKVRLLCVGKPSKSYLREGIDDYAARIGRYLPFSQLEFKEEKGGRKGDPRQLVRREGERLLARIPEDSFLVSLDERGRGLSTAELADFLGERMQDGTKELCLVIGGPYGLADEVQARSRMRLSLSPLTLPHQLARLLLLEQLYRALTVIRGEPYHH